MAVNIYYMLAGNNTVILSDHLIIFKTSLNRRTFGYSSQNPQVSIEKDILGTYIFNTDLR